MQHFVISLERSPAKLEMYEEIVYGGLIHAKVEREFDELWWFVNIVEVDSLLVFGSICDIIFWIKVELLPKEEEDFLVEF